MLIWFFYNGLLMHNYGMYREDTKNYQFFKYLAHSFKEGRLYLQECPPSSNCHDLVVQDDKIYFYWPPVPALVYIPLVAWFGLETPDQAISHIIGAINVLLFSLLVVRFSRHFGLKIPFWQNTLFTLFYGIGTVHFYLVMHGIVWTFAQVLGQTFLLASVLVFLSNPVRFRNLFWSGVFFALMCYTRNNMVFYAFLFLGIAIPLFPAFSTKQIFRRALVFLIPFFIFSVVNLWYNYARFGDIFENGLEHHNMAAGYRKNFVKHGYFSVHYVPHNLWYEVFAPPPPIDKFPFFNPKDHYGFGLLWASPLFLLFFPALVYFSKQTLRSVKNKSPGNWVEQHGKEIFLAGNILSLLSISFVIFCIMGTGWLQFGSRYSLDYQLALILPIVLFSTELRYKKWFWILFIVLLLCSIYMNYFGAWYFHDLYEKSKGFWLEGLVE